MKKRPYTTGKGRWATLLGGLSGMVGSTAWVLPAAVSADPTFLWGMPVTLASGLVIGWNYKRKMKQVDLHSARAISQVDAALGRIKKLAENPAFSDQSIINHSLQEALRSRELFLDECVQLSDLRRSGVFSPGDLQRRTQEANENAAAVFTIEAQLKKHLREVENFKYDARSAGLEALKDVKRTPSDLLRTPE